KTERDTVQWIYWKIRFFFFQAEDGIRGFHVTGVQTCALPILMKLARLWAKYTVIPDSSDCISMNWRSAMCDSGSQDSTRSVSVRSEERRVGKERRERGTVYD